MHALIILTIAISLSMVAFSLALAYGTLNLEKKDIISTAIIVGIYHFFMPLLGNGVGNIILKLFPLNPSAIVFVVLVFIGIQMIIEGLKNAEEVKKLSFLEKILFGLAVSIDSFSVGIGLQSISKRTILCALTFSISSFVFTYIGLMFGKKINSKVGSISTIVGGIVLIILGIFYLFN